MRNIILEKEKLILNIEETDTSLNVIFDKNGVEVLRHNNMLKSYYTTYLVTKGLMTKIIDAIKREDVLFMSMILFPADNGGYKLIGVTQTDPGIEDLKDFEDYLKKMWQDIVSEKIKNIPVIFKTDHMDYSRMIELLQQKQAAGIYKNKRWYYILFSNAFPEAYISEMNWNIATESYAYIKEHFEKIGGDFSLIPTGKPVGLSDNPE